MTNRPILIAATLVAALFTATSCGSPEKIPYMIQAENLSDQQLKHMADIYEARIMTNDELTISVHTTVPEAGAPFNLGSNAGSMMPEQRTSTGMQGAKLQTYLVDKEGYIDYPIIGRINVKGLTRVEAQEFIKSKIHPAYITEEPVVVVRFHNYKISVLGEVKSPGQYTISNEHCTLLDALAMAGDLTIYGKRSNIMLIREDNDGRKHIQRINLQDPYAVLDPANYYLQQNDVIYVEPNKAQARASGIGRGETYAISIISTLISVTTLLVTIFR
jgi:polysaccharide export outer membrane protein